MILGGLEPRKLARDPVEGTPLFDEPSEVPPDPSCVLFSDDDMLPLFRISAGSSGLTSWNGL